jgi:hypothetical protein
MASEPRPLPLGKNQVQGTTLQAILHEDRKVREARKKPRYSLSVTISVHQWLKKDCDPAAFAIFATLV